MGLSDEMTLTAVKVILSLMQSYKDSNELFDYLRVGGVLAKYFQQKGHRKLTMIYKRSTKFLMSQVAPTKCKHTIFIGYKTRFPPLE